MMNRLKEAMAALNRSAQRHRLLLCALLAVLVSGAFALYNVSSGPLHNLNDIGGWRNRALFIAMCAAVHAGLMMLCAWLSHVSLARTALRQMIVTAGMMILLLAINQKSYAYVRVIQPVVRAMDAGGLAAGLSMADGFSAPMILLLYIATRGPVYDMYLLKLMTIGCYIALALLMMRAMDRRHAGLRAEVLLSLCLILPQGFMNAACSALPEIAAVLLLAVSLALALDCDRPRMTASALCYGASCALCGAALYALPVYVWLVQQGRMQGKQLLIGAGAAMALCLPAVLCGMPILQAVGSLASANLGLPPYAGGAPGIANLIPRAAVEEMPQYAPLLRHLPALDLETHAQPFYTQAHFAVAMRGMTLAGLAAYMGVCAWVWRAKDRTPLHRVMALALGALMICPNVTAGIWLALDVLCLYAVLTVPGLRLPACLVLFATACSACYPMTEEVLLPMVYACLLCLAALCMLMGVIPMEKNAAEERAMGREDSHE